MKETIAAISTPYGSGGISIVRISGSEAITIADSIFQGHLPLAKAKTHTIHHGKAIDYSNKKMIDDALASVMRAPKSYTGEDTVEISIHGSMLSADLVLKSAIGAGARLAQAGEFTRRAFLNGKIDLAQAEAVIDIIHSKTTRAHENAVSQLEGHLSAKINQIREQLLNVAAAIGVSADYTDEGFDEDGRDKLHSILSSCYHEVVKLWKGAQYGMVMKEGIVTAIAGSPNVGKSSLLNMLSGADRAIVTEIPGTTRDVVEESVNIGGLLLRLADTAGIRQTSDQVEKIGIERSYAYMENADLIILVLDSSNVLTKQDRELLNQTEGRTRLIVLNKTDLVQKLDEKELSILAKGTSIVRICARNGSGADELAKTVRELFLSGEAESKNGEFVTNARQTESLLRAKEHLEYCLETLNRNECVDLVSIDLNDAIADLGEILGLSVSEEVVDRIFSQFCVGK
jgi:tRNA modification GTPase